MNKYVKAAMRERFESEAVADGITTYCSRMSINDDSKFSTTELVLAKAFEASYDTARPLAEWIAIANALDSNYLGLVGEKRVLLGVRRMARAKLIRSRRHAGKTLYELNLEWGLK